MKKVYSPFADFYIPEKRCCFWVRVVMQTAGGKTSKTTNHEAIYVCSSPCKKHRKHLTAIAALFVPGVAEHRIAESPGRNEPGALYFFSNSSRLGGFLQYA